MTALILESQTVINDFIVLSSLHKKNEMIPTDQAILDHGIQSRLSFLDRELVLITWGSDSPPAVLLMYGWGRSRAQMTAFVEPLLDAGLFLFLDEV